jgi:hypothetical protein
MVAAADDDPRVRSSLQDGFHVILVNWEPIGNQSATFKVYHNPLVNFVWFGGIVFIFGTLIAAWPGADPRLSRGEHRRASAVAGAWPGSLHAGRARTPTLAPVRAAGTPVRVGETGATVRAATPAARRCGRQSAGRMVGGPPGRDGPPCLRLS